MWIDQDSWDNMQNDIKGIALKSEEDKIYQVDMNKMSQSLRDEVKTVLNGECDITLISAIQFSIVENEDLINFEFA